MANEVRVTHYFGQGRTGWSETWWYPPGLGSTFWGKLQSMTEKRCDLLVANHTLLAVRVTVEGANRFTRLINAGGPTAIDAAGPIITLPGRGKEDGLGTRVEGPPDQVRAAMHLEVVKAGQRIGLRYLAGFPDSISKTEDLTLDKTVNTIWWDLFAAWRQEIVDNGWAIKLLDKGTGFPLTNVITYRLRVAAPSVLGVVIPLAAPFTHTPGMRVLLQGVRMVRKGLDSPNGQWYIDGIETDVPNSLRTIWLRGTEGFDPDTFLTLGKLRAKQEGFQTPSWLEPVRVGIHKRGKPFGSPVGRRTTR